jgi:hypothetical protein
MTTKITKFVIYGERCSGTNYLEEVMKNNFDIHYTTEHGNKHFFCFNDYNNKSIDNTLFIGIVRNPVYWLNSFCKEMYHVPEINRKFKNFLFNEFYSVLDEERPVTPYKDLIHGNNNFLLQNNNLYVTKYELNKKDLNYITGNKYKNIFELRKLKNDYLMNIIPKKVTNYILINYENLLYNLDKTLHDIQSKFDLTPKHSEYINIKKYKKSDSYNFVRQRMITFNTTIIDTIWKNLDVNQENYLGYYKNDNNNNFINNYFLLK